jgi:hypothetical protein
MKPAEVPRLRRNATFVLPEWKLVFVSTPKAACTSIKWMLADLQGIDHRKFHASLSGETTRATTIHQHRYVWQPGTPRLLDLTKEQLAEITAANGWFFFTMTRHPTMRLWSAWQSKFLMREPRFRVQFASEPWLPRIPETTDDVVEDWEAFVSAIAADPETPIMKDNHFRPQSLLLNVPRTRYHRIYDTSEFGEMRRDVHAHVERLGWTTELPNPRSNESPLPAITRVFPPHIVDAIAKVYADDFAKLSYDDPMPAKVRAEDYSPDLLAATGIIAERGERIGDLSRRARRLSVRLDGPRKDKGAPVRSKSAQPSARSGLRRTFRR